MTKKFGRVKGQSDTCKALSLSSLSPCQVLYLVLWCGVYSTVHLYMGETITDFWVLCLCVSLVSIAFTTVILLILHHNSKEVHQYK